MNLTKNLFVILAFVASLAMVGCGGDDKCDKTCGADEILTANCTCESTLPCDGKKCADDEILDASNCSCVKQSACPGVTCGSDETLDVANCACVKNNEVISGTISEDVTWTADRIYELASKVVVDNGATLTIEPGTIVKGREGTGSQATALVVARGSKIEACGTADAPIIFTSILDDIKIGQKSGSNLGENDREKWGGIIVLGYAPISAKDGDTETQIEGIPADESYGKYGGSDAADNSGSLCYVSIRHGGALIGDGNEINGLTLGGVGNGTKIENIEVVANLDDGVEFFGGTVDAKNILVAYQGDDAIDIDMNYSGTVDNAYIIHGGDDTDEAFEIDGPENSTYTDGKFTVVNATAIAVDQTKTSGADLKSKAQGTLKGVSFQGYGSKNIKVESVWDTSDGCADKSSAYLNMVAGNLVIMDSELVSSDLTLDNLAKVTVPSKKDNTAQQQTCLDGSDYQGVADTNVASMGNKVSASATAGAVRSEFDWTWAASKGLVK